MREGKSRCVTKKELGSHEGATKKAVKKAMRHKWCPQGEKGTEEFGK